MSDIIFLSPSSESSSLAQLAQECKANLLLLLQIRIVEETLRPDEDNLVFKAKYSNWLEVPEPKITLINNLGIETLQFEDTNYDISLQDGSVEFDSAVTDIVRADYNFFPFTDSQIVDILKHSLHEISVLIFRPIPEDNIHGDYKNAICKRLYTNLLKALILEARDYFTVSVGGRSINKSNIVNQINEIINQNEKQLQSELTILRTHNKTNRMIPTLTQSTTISSNAQIVP